MTKQKRYITFYQLKWKLGIPYIKSYGLMCSRSWWKCLKLGIRHVKNKQATFFWIEKKRPKKHLFGN